MIISASRRTDLPAYYSAWFFNRLREGYVLVRNPVNPHRISRIRLSPDVVDGIVFWTKNPLPMLQQLDRLRPYPFYFQFTLTAYGADVEPGVPNKGRVLIPAFRQLANLIGPERVLWRYDPIFLSRTYSMAYHIRQFEALAKRLRGCTTRCTISFLDFYRNTAKNTAPLQLLPFSPAQQRSLAAALAEIAHSCSIRLESCAEPLDLHTCGIEHGRCIDAALFSSLTGYPIEAKKDPNQRKACSCMESIDIGAYNTCRAGCRYCYANHSAKTVCKNVQAHRPDAPLLTGTVLSDDTITERPMTSCIRSQLQIL